MRGKLVLGFALAALSLGLIATLARGNDKSHVTATLDGFEETPAVFSAGSGEFSATIDDEGQTIHFTLTYTELSSPTVVAAHIHFGQSGFPGGISAFLCGGGKPACPASGTVTGTITPADVIGPASQGIKAGEWRKLVAAIRAGVSYANVHTSVFPAGEIRGQIHNDDEH